MLKRIMTGSTPWLTGGAWAAFPAEKDHVSFLRSQLSHYIHSIFISHFLLLWALLAVFIAVCAFFLGGHGDPLFPALTPQGASLRRPSLSRRLSLIDGIAAILLLLFVGLYVFQIFYKEDFNYYDDEVLTDFSIQGRDFPPPIWPGVGRFFPLAEQEFNLFRFVTRSPAGYHSFVAVELIVLLVVLFVLLRRFEFHYRALILIAVMLAPSFVIPFGGFVYPERNVLFWLTIILLCVQGYSESKKRIYFVACLVATHFVLYYKEMVVIFVVAFAITQLLLQLCAGNRSWHELIKENSLSLGMLAVSGIYVVLFLAAMLPQRNFSYVAGHHESLSSVLLVYVRIDWLPLILLAILLVRFGRFMFSAGQLDFIWDSLGVGALAYFFGVIALRLNSGYYMAPVDFIALLYLANLSLIWLSTPTRVRVSVVAIVFICVFLHDAAYSSFRIVERKTVITTKSELSDFLKGYLPTANNNTVELYFPYASGFRLMELSAYLTYKGFHLMGQSATLPETGPSLVIEAREKFTNNRCVDYRDYACVHMESAGTGALIVVLPDDNASMRDVELIGMDSTPLLSLKAPGISTMKWFRSLHAISPSFSTSQLPDHWLQLHVFKKISPLSISSLQQPTMAGTSGEDGLSFQAR